MSSPLSILLFSCALVVLFCLSNVAAAEQNGQSEADQLAAAKLASLLAEKGIEDADVTALVREHLAKERERRLQRCSRLLSPAICKNVNAQPFYLWTSIAARNIVQDNDLDSILKKAVKQQQMRS